MCATKKHARALWGATVQRHTFFRRRKQPRVQNAVSIKNFAGLGRRDPLLRAHIHPSGKTEFETEEEVE